MEQRIADADDHLSSIERSGTFALGSRVVKRLGYGAMRLSGPGIFGSPRDRPTALAILREAVASGVNHIDTSDYYGPHITNALIREALHPYPDDLVIVTKIGARRGEDASWLPASSPAELRQAVHDNLRNLSLEALERIRRTRRRGVGDGVGVEPEARRPLPSRERSQISSRSWRLRERVPSRAPST